MSAPTEKEIAEARARLAPYLRVVEDWVIREMRGWDNPDRDRARLAVARAAAGEAVLRSVAAAGFFFAADLDDVSERPKWVLVNTYGFNDFPPEVKAWDASVGPHVFYPAPILAAFALERPIPNKPERDKLDELTRASQELPGGYR